MGWAAIPSPIGTVYLESDGAAITALRFEPEQPLCEPCSPLLRAAAAQLAEYFMKTRRTFDLPLAPQGTPFQQRVWQALLEIPYGETRTYGEIAAAVGSPRGFRAVGQANHCNPIAILIPCHRVIGASGALTGYAGGLEYKEYLLKLEGVL